MNLGDFNIKNSNKDLLSENTFINSVKDFIKDLSTYLQNKKIDYNNDSKNINKEVLNYHGEREKYMNIKQLKEDKTYVASDISDNSINVVDIENGDEIKVYVSTDDETKESLNNAGIFDSIFEMDKMDFLKLKLTDNIVLKENKLYSNSNKIEIKNYIAWRLLSDLYMSERETEGKQYKVLDIKDNKIYLTNADGTGGYFSIHKELYPDLKTGDLVVKNNREYSKVKGISNE